MSPASDFPKAVLFDLDDTFFDHEHCSRLALWRVRGEHPVLAGARWGSLLESYSTLLEEIHSRLLKGELTLQEARRERIPAAVLGAWRGGGRRRGA